MERRCIVYHTPGPEGGWFRFIDNPTIGDIRYARERGAFILRRRVQRIGNQVHTAWITDEGKSIVERIDYL